MPIRVIPALLGQLQIRPVLLHGDLWVLHPTHALCLGTNDKLEWEHWNRCDHRRAHYLRPIVPLRA